MLFFNTCTKQISAFLLFALIPNLVPNLVFAENIDDIEKKYPLNSQNCDPSDYTYEKIMATVLDWDELDAIQGYTSTRSMIAENMLVRLQDYQHLTDLSPRIFLICDSKKAIYTIGFFDTKTSDFLEVEYLLTHPNLEKNGGGTAALRRAIALSVLKKKAGVKLKPAEAVRKFYLRRGFIQSNPVAKCENPNEQYFYLGKKQIINSFSEFASFFKFSESLSESSSEVSGELKEAKIEN